VEPKRPIDSAGRADASVTSPDSLLELRTKYLELAGKYAALVRRLEVRARELKRRRADGEIFLQRLGFWALTATGGGLAVLKDGEVTIRNARWHELSGARGGWVREGTSAGRPAYVRLSQVALDEARQVPDRPPAVLVRRYCSLADAQVIELRLERVGSETVVVLAQDVTAQAKAEEELSHTREALFRSEHLSILGELAASIAHEMGNTLRAVSTRATVLCGDPSVMATHAQLLKGLQESIEAALDSVRKLHELARSGRLEPGPIDLKDVIQRAVEVLQLRQPPGAPQVRVDVRIPQHLPLVLGTTSELSHLFVTLLFNARDAMPEGGKVEVRAERAGDRVRVSVTDEGTGIDAEHMTHLFQPFFTTKGSAGTGLGLWLAHSTMRRLGGSITAHNRGAGGAEFLVEFQLAGNGAFDRRRRERGPALVKPAGSRVKPDRGRQPRRGRDDRDG
jgi:signal transduction histidine kinase